MSSYAYLQSNAHFHKKEINMKTLHISMSQKDYITIATIWIPINSTSKISSHRKNNLGLNLTYYKNQLASWPNDATSSNLIISIKCLVA